MSENSECDEFQECLRQTAVDIRKRFHYFGRHTRHIRERLDPSQPKYIDRKGGDQAAHWGNILLDWNLARRGDLEWEDAEFHLYGVTFKDAELILGECFSHPHHLRF
jgi:hypothetical protein